MKENTHEGSIDVVVCCNDPEDSNYGISKDIEPEILEKHNLKPGDKVVYKIVDEKVEIIGRLKITKTIEKINQ